MRTLCVRRNLLMVGVVWSLLAAVSAPAAASVITYSGSSGNLSASVTFSLTGNTLNVDLTNTSSHDVLLPQDVLTAVFFSTAHSLTPVSASLNGSSVFYGSLSNVGDGWGYYNNLAGGGHGKNDGITSAGFGIGKGHSNFSNQNNHLDGIDYGLLSAGDNPTTGNTGVKGHGPLLRDSAEFTLTVANGFSLSELGDTVVFQYGSALSEPHFDGHAPTPEPGTLLLMGSAMLGMAGLLRRKLQ
jgi:hypothetical protein